MEAKFKIGDKVRLNRRTPKYIREELKWQRTRTIKNVWYDPTLQCSLYDLGKQGKGVVGYAFRGYMLTPVSRRLKHTRGKPRVKRSYRHKNT